MSTLLSGPAGAGKSQEARRMLDAATVPTVVVDFQAIYGALLLLERQPNGRYPERLPAQGYALALTEYVRLAAISGAVGQQLDVIATNSHGSPERRQMLLQRLGPGATERVIDPGVFTVRARLEVNGRLSPNCDQAIARWYDNL